MGRLFYLQIVKHDYYTAVAQDQYYKNSDLPAKRGEIYVKDNYADSGKSKIAMNNINDELFADPVMVDNKEEASEKISSIIGLSKEEVLDKLNHPSSPRYVKIKEGLSMEEEAQIKEINLNGLRIAPRPSRYWPEKALMAQVIGFVNKTGTAQYGVEQAFDSILKGKPGKLKAERDAMGTIIATGNNVLIKPVDGDSLVLTIDKNVQATTEEILKNSVEKHGADSGSVLVMDPNTGGIIAMASYFLNEPELDLNNYYEIEDYRFFDNLNLRQYEPGSVFKVITMAAGLDSGKIKPEDTFNDSQYIVVGGNKIYNADRKKHGTVSMSYILEQSLNLGTAYIQGKLGEEDFFNYLTKTFGFGMKTGIEFDFEDGGKVYGPNEVNDHTYATMSFGQSIAVTPLQMSSAVSVIANGGNLVRPKIIESFMRQGIKEEKKETEIIKRAISEEAAKEVTKMMINTIEKGHGKQAKVSGYKVAGKTGTAQVPVPGGYDPNKTIGSFVGFAPATNPRFVIYTKIDNPKDVEWAESSAAPVFHDVLENLLMYYNIPPDDN
ncbi:MAG: Peptidoglycan glycosyltransferase [candidate division CPR2 bacterium GW2011_GWC1_39_9]|nr:MAG: Peptidoglycan glycosyltransferase [candidate division CPR2 bacterium GW2011_GWC1_39_9]